ncbi:Pga2p ASCRUDRAFT_85610 [Ascoidea rubescens DSM 1968]|uniref:Uncharacterized protein n=1 Tax=Ascoidea rubescens DSM 1968 TaxID=1344418 RepID=A0A1D2VI29_9ASCO|nr:hypothetical protein ASCRUDRAFT_85610 [Ascoidea rubescens DSM 1968]ODV61316.1 hypothetical protein ASCRUDRAFT_85610 [Ascoidea rubescens DSM 1968]
MSESLTPTTTFLDLLYKFQNAIPSFYFNLILHHCPDDILNIDYTRAVRLIIIVSAYIFFRKLFVNHQKIKTSKNLLKKHTDANNVDYLFNNSLENQNQNQVQNNITHNQNQNDQTDKNKSFSWGKQTREKNAKILNTYKQKISNFNNDDDLDDIKELLED